MINDAYWKRLLACERRQEATYRALIALQKFMRQIFQQLQGVMGKQ